MTKRERELIAKIYGHLNTMGSLTPANPADVRAVSINLRTSTRMAKALQMALHHTAAGEYPAADSARIAVVPEWRVRPAASK